MFSRAKTEKKLNQTKKLTMTKHQLIPKHQKKITSTEYRHKIKHPQTKTLKSVVEELPPTVSQQRKAPSDQSET